MQDGFIKVAACTPKVRVADVNRNVEACVAAIREAAQRGAKLIVLPELCITGATCGDLFWQDRLLAAASDGIARVAQETSDIDALVFVGAPIQVDAKLYSCAVALNHGEVLGVVPKRRVASAQTRHFVAGPLQTSPIDFGESEYVPFGANQLFTCEALADLVVAAELGEDLWAPQPPSVVHALSGATVVVNLSAMPSLVGSAAYAQSLVMGQSARLLCGYVCANAGWGESTTDAVYGGQDLIAENGTLLAESQAFGDGMALSELDVCALVAERRRSFGFSARDDELDDYVMTPCVLEQQCTELTRTIDPEPFMPAQATDRAERCEEILNIQAHALAGRLAAIGSKQVVVGVSGGLDSTLAMLVCARAFDLVGLDHAGILAITMPGFGTTDRTHNNAWQLALALGATPREIPIGASVRQHFADIEHDENVHNAAYENAQARERTQILMDVANDLGGLVVGTGDLSELALGWATYNGDHMSMYAVNAAVPKTLIRHIVRHVANTCGNDREAEVLIDVLETPVSPELLPANDDGTIAQQTEDLVGPYELHDFFVYHLLRNAFTPAKIYRLACVAFEGVYEPSTVLSWLKVFCRRFFSQQFKRSCSPDGPAVGSVGLSPRGGLVMPSDAASALWLAELEQLG